MDQGEISKKIFKCNADNCEWTFDTPFKLKRHEQTHSGVKPFSCKKCNRSFASTYNLSTHDMNCHKTIQCMVPQCNQTFKSNILYNNHLKKKHTELKFRCSRKKCNVPFKTKEQLITHLTKHINDFVCKECGKEFNKPYLLQQHFTTHTGDLNFKCSYEGCLKAFSNKSRLNRHEKLHENQREYFCELKGCAKRFNLLENLKKHRESHRLYKDHQCPVCFKMFVTTQTLKVHLQIHSGHRPYKCDNCFKTYLTSSNLKSHLLKSHPKLVDRDEGSSIETCDQYLNVDATLSNRKYNTEFKEQFTTADLGHSLCNEYIHSVSSKTLATSPSKYNNKFVNSFYPGVYEHDYERLSSFHEKLGFGSFSDPILSGQGAYINQSKPSDDDLGEVSMELSTGHLVVGGNPVSCMPDHLYSHPYTESTINLEDIRP